MRIDNDDVWQQIKSGELRGVSIEGYFVNAAEKLASVKPNEPTDEEILLALHEILTENKTNE